jgi:sugar phosphate isomerase/epimerase/uncharacterized protein YceK
MLKLQNLFFVLLTFALLSACGSKTEKTNEEDMATNTEASSDYQISLAQWSLHKSIFGELPSDWSWFGRMLQESPDSLLRGEIDPMDFPQIAAEEYGIHTIELVNTFYYGKAKDMDYWMDFKAKCDQYDVEVGLIMCDALGDIGNADEAARMQAVENHYAWVDIAERLGAESIRVNAAGQGTAEEVAANAVDGLKKLAEYAAPKGINILVENHGGYSSDGSWLAGVMAAVDMDNVGTLPDFGNFCIERGPNGCANEYDRYKGMEELMPYAKGVSAKAHEFDEAGYEKHSDFVRIMKIVKESGFTGDVGIEYEGDQLSEDEGIKKTKALLEKVFAQI